MGKTLWCTKGSYDFKNTNDFDVDLLFIIIYNT